MIKKQAFQPAHRERGVTLIELLVSLTIGLVILIAIGIAYFNSTNITRQRDNQSELNEPAHVILRLLQHDLSNAGYVDFFDLDTTSGTQAAALFVPGNDVKLNLYQRIPQAAPLATPLSQFFPGLMPIFGCDGAMNSTPNGIMNTAPPVVLACGVADATKNSLQIAYQAVPGTTLNPIVSLLPSNAATGEGRDCNQQNVSPAGAKLVVNRYFVQASAGDGINELYCSGSGNNVAQPMARGVEEFVLRYQTAQPGTTPPVGVSAIAAGGAQAQYVNAATVAASAIGWANVTAVEVCMVSATSITSGSAASGTTILQPTRPTCARDAAGNFAANIARVAGDARLWKRFTSVISVRNAVYSTPN